MRSLQDYRDIYKEIASSYNITGDSVELLVQLLANASYISEIENISYVQEASLERSTLVNSKIQHCMDMMYSVFRGRCPRVIMKIKPTKYMRFDVYDQIVSSNSFNVYYLGYYNGVSDNSINNVTGTKGMPLEEGFIYGPCEINPAIDENDTVVVIGLLAKEKISESWVTNKNNAYYVETLEENLSSDLYVKIGSSDKKEFIDTTRIFSDHILKHYIFDLTTTSYSSRLYVADIYRDSDILDRNDEPSVSSSGPDVNIYLDAVYYKFSSISEYKQAELKKINISGSEMVGFDSEFLESRGCSEIAPGVIIVNEVGREGVGTIHYKANRDRFVSSIVRSNSDVGVVLEETYPSKVMRGGTNFTFTSGDDSSSGSRVSLFYVPNDPLNLLTNTEISEFINAKKAYYIVDDIYISEGKQYTAFFNVDIELYKPYTIDDEVYNILSTYEKKFSVNLEKSIDEIRTLLSKISNVKQVMSLDITYLDPDNNSGNGASNEDVYNDIYDSDGNIKPDVYFKINYKINSIIQTRS